MDGREQWQYDKVTGAMAGFLAFFKQQWKLECKPTFCKTKSNYQSIIE